MNEFWGIFYERGAWDSHMISHQKVHYGRKFWKKAWCI